jgi:hypothetical protein
MAVPLRSRTGVSSRLHFALAVGAVVACCAACGSGPAPTPTGGAAAGTDPADATTAPAAATASALPGEPSVYGPEAGTVVAVIGVPYTDAAPLRAAPAADGDTVAELPADADDLEATGRNRAVGADTWYEVRYDGVAGWVSARDAGQLGGTDDATAELVASLGGTPTAATITELGELVAAEFSYDEPPSRIAQTGPAIAGDLHEVAFDVLGLGDDATLGYRLHVFGDPTLQPGQVALSSVERTAICARGATADGLCV